MKTIALLLAVLLLASTVALAADHAPSSDIQAITKPSGDVTLSFNHPGRVAEMLVKEGDTVTKDQLVAKQDDTEEQAALDVARAQANDDTRTMAQETVRDQKKATYERKKETPGAATAQEISEALLDWEVGKANVILSQFEHVQDGRKAKQNEAALEKTRLKTPIAGIVFQTMVKAGENVDTQNMKVMRIVNVDPVWIDVAVPFSRARTLKNADPASIAFSNKEIRQGKIIFVAPVADAASDTLTVRVEVPNPRKDQAGERVTVSFAPAANVAAGDNH